MGKKRHRSIGIALMCIILLSGCSLGQENAEQTLSEQEDSEQQEEPEAEEHIVYRYEVDLTHDGEDETLLIDLGSILADGQQPALLSVLDVDEEVLYEDTLSLSREGWNSFYLCRHNDADYLLSYSANHSQGTGIYVYTLYYLDEQQLEVTEDTGSVQFDMLKTDGNADVFIYPKDEMVAFAETVNGYLAESFLLVSTDGGELRYSTPEEILQTHETFADLIEETEDIQLPADYDAEDIRSNVELFGEYLEQQYRE